MLRIGEYQTLTIAREMPQGLYLEDAEGNEALMPWAYVPENWELGQEMQVFVYWDAEERELATTETPLLTLGGFALLEVKDVNNVGAFCDWGVSKQLFIPFSNQKKRLQPGQKVVVHLYIDDLTDRLVGTTKLEQFLRTFADHQIHLGDKVEALVYSKSELGYKVVVNQRYAGMIHAQDAPPNLAPGQQVTGYMKPPREDGKIDISLDPVGHRYVEPNAQAILEKLEANGGFLPYHDKSDPEAIRREFGISKKLFKKALGVLYRQRLVVLREDGIHKA